MESEFFNLHYYLSDTSHSMNAVVRNKCEKEILAAAYEIASVLKIDLDIETFAYTEGGLKEHWKALGKNSPQLTLLIAILMAYFTIYPRTDSELTELDKEEKRLQIEKSKLEIEKLKKEAEASSRPVEETAQIIAQSLQSHGKAIVRRSNYYKLLNDYLKVNSVGYNPGPTSPNPIPEIVVQRAVFSRFILKSDKLPVETDENAVIDIYSPVLINGKYHWRGNYKGTTISFSMLDHKFRRSIVNKGIQFQNGTSLRCVLSIFRKFNELGEVVVTGYSVLTVLDVSESGEKFVETPQGRTHRHVKALIESQQSLFKDSDPST
jgi:hypothetical protein